MIAADTNIVLRLITADDEHQYALATALLARGPLFVSAGVMLEAEWALRKAFGYDRARVVALLTDLIRLPDILVERALDVIWALERHALGADFADMLHLTGTAGCASFATFDRKVARDAGAAPPVPIETLG